MTADELINMSEQELRDYVTAELRIRYWTKVQEHRDDLVINGTNGASDESLEFFDLQRTS